MALKLGFDCKANSGGSENIDTFSLIFLIFRKEANLSDRIVNKTKDGLIISLFILKPYLQVVRGC